MVLEWTNGWRSEMEWTDLVAAGCGLVSERVKWLVANLGRKLRTVVRTLQCIEVRSKC